MIVLGLNTQHDGGCCLIRDGKVQFAISEERLTRIKGSRGFLYALRYCLSNAGISLSDVDLAVFSSYDEPLPADFRGGFDLFTPTPPRCTTLDHHLSHAWSAFLTSPFDEALIIAIDGSGNGGGTESYFVGAGKSVRQVGSNQVRSYHRGVGKTYEAFTSFLGWTMMQSAHTMALAALGDPAAFADLEVFSNNDDQVNGLLRRKYVQGVVEFAREAGVEFGAPFDRGQTKQSRDVARFIQDRTEKAVVRYVRNLISMTGLKHICLSGGVALNCVLNRRVLDDSGAEALWVVPCASDKGQCLGNALYGAHGILDAPRPAPLRDDSFGCYYGDEEIRRVLDRRMELGNNFIVEAPGIRYEKIADPAAVAAKCLADGRIVGWFQGGSELGARALGHRSILADPRDRRVSQRLSSTVKRREPFRPYAPSVLEEAAATYFDLPCPSPFMQLVGRVRPEYRDSFPSVVHVDGTARIQTVSSLTNPRYHRLIAEFGKLTGVPLVLNTSFNRRGEPIVETPHDAIATLLSTGIDVLLIEDYFVEKCGRPGLTA
jgi:carbamoyltransferase